MSIFRPILVLLLAALPAVADTLTLEQYLEQVRTKNDAYRASVEKRDGAQGRVGEGGLTTSPVLLANANLRYDSKLPALPFIQYDRLDTHFFGLGLQQQFSFGLLAKLQYQWDYTQYANFRTGGAPTALPVSFWDARPVLEVSMPLLSNGFGRGVRAQALLAEAQATADRESAEAERRALEQQAEVVYWNLSLARELVRQQELAVTAAESLYSYVARKESLNLGDKADALQAKASLELRKYERKLALDAEQAAARSFNKVRNTPVTTPADAVLPIQYEGILAYQPPASHGTRAETRAAEAQSKAAQAAAIAAQEKNKPELNLVASAALNGRDLQLAKAFPNSYDANRPTYSAGLQFKMPLDFSATGDARSGAAKQEKAAELSYRQKLVDQEQDWLDLTTKLVDARERYAMAASIEQLQKDKLVYERQRLRQGRTTTFQVLQFETEYTLAGVSRARAAFDLLQLVASLKLYEGEKS